MLESSKAGWHFGVEMLPIYGSIAGKFYSKFPYLIHFVQLSTNGLSIFRTIPLYNKRYAVKNISLESRRASNHRSLFSSDYTSHWHSKSPHHYELLSKTKRNALRWRAFLFELYQARRTYSGKYLGSARGIYRGYLLANLITILHLNIYINVCKLWRSLNT